MTEQSLSRLESANLRDVWRGEATDFTPWLAKNIDELGDALGIELEAQERESSIGNYRLDILATDINSGHKVIIENQLGWSDTDHLGRLLIYAANKDADIVIWIARGFTEEHWQVLQWLNQRVNARTRFFGVAVQLWRIDDSRPAPFFHVVAAPNDYKRPALPFRRRYRDFRIAMEDRLRRECDLPFEPGSDHKNPWLAINHVDGLNYSVDFRDRIFFSFQLDTRGNQSKEWCHRGFDRLERDKEHIEKTLGQMEWRRDWQRGRGSSIMSHCPTRFSDAPDSWPEVRNWVIERYRRFREVFEPYRDELLGSDDPAE